jgi:hypothetical protein
MSDDLNQANPGAAKADLVAKAARYGAAGWVAFFLVLFALIAQNLILALSPKEVLATTDGKVVGQVVFDEPRIRSSDDIMIDLKSWVQHCTSVNKNTIYEDLSICVNHMKSDLAETRVRQYQQNNYAVSIANSGCNRTKINFDDQASSLQRDRLGYGVEGTIVGEVICPKGKGEPVSQEFNVKVVAQLVPRDTNFPLGLKVVEYEDVES